jgi:protein-S-isoprenylcysteine O-methyltransferase Ste14
MPVWVRAAIFIAIAPGAIAGWLPWYVAGRPSDIWGASHGAWRLGALLAIAGWVFLLWCARDFAVRGRGTPGPYDPPRELVTSGLYEYVRNPMYIAVLTAILGQAIWYQSFGVVKYALFVALMFHVWVLIYEEPALRRSFGASYITYCERVSRWLPRVGRW